MKYTVLKNIFIENQETGKVEKVKKGETIELDAKTKLAKGFREAKAIEPEDY